MSGKVPPGFEPLPVPGAFIAANGPLYIRHDANGVRMGFRVEARHTNPLAICHGGMMASFCDMLLPIVALRTRPEIGLRFLPTVSLQIDYLAPAALGSWVEGRAEVLRVTRTLVFAQGLVDADGEPAARASGVLKIGPAFPALGGVAGQHDLVEASFMDIRPIEPDDYAGWLPLWEGYNAFYGREGATALDPQITAATWQRFFDAAEPVFGLVAVDGDRLLGLTHYLYHRSTTRLELTCYLQDLFTHERERGRGIGRALIEGVYRAAGAAGIRRVYWLTHETNTPGRRLYDQVARHGGFIVYTHDL